MQMRHQRRGGATATSAPASGWRSAVASYYGTDGTSGGCGMANGPLTFASLIVPCGSQVQFCRGGACVTGTRTDSGPYIAGRSFDLSTEMASTLGFTSAGVASVNWRLVH
jgi:rare lipoprotein A (peptidoglycan hydrolase)